MSQSQTAGELAPRPDWALDAGVIAGDAWISVAPEQIRNALRALYDQGFKNILFMTAVDHLATPVAIPPPERFEVVYQLRDVERHLEVRVRTFLPEENPHIASVQDIYPPANWDERETYDLFGIVFDGHPDLRRILMPDDWIGHPLRRDYPV
ncbi:MAG: NADH-quinone oxidoreductase subunit C, partial [Candidatus Dormibacteraeota bacterium]|nr:NADH-quinone oxidoreductase subunit C [Candidatus Dormibacteraeota bacterium]